MKKIQALVLAAGKGTRLKAKDKPKVMYPLRGRPIIDCVVKTLKSAGFEKPILVIGFHGELVKNYLKNRSQYVWQKNQLGTAHAVLQAKNALKNYCDVLIVLGDMPFWKPETLKKLISLHEKSNATLSLISVILENPSFYAYGRIIRDKNNDLIKIVEEKEATAAQKKIKECNPSCYLVKTGWLFKNLNKISANGGSASGGKKTSGEYYLTDILELAISQKEKIAVLPISDKRETLGINTSEHLQLAEKLIMKA